MPPKKAEPRKPAQEKVPRTRRKREKPLNTSTLTKIPIPTKVVSNDVDNLNKKAEPDLPVENIKVMLANEVVRRQFRKKANFVEYPDFSEQDKPNVKNKPTRKRKVVLKKNVVKTNDVGEPAPKRSRRNLKKSIETTEEVANETLPEQPKQAQNTRLPSKRTRSVRKTSAQKVCTDTSTDKQEEINQNEAETEKPKTIMKSNVSLNRIIAGPKTRQRLNRIIKDESEMSNEPKIDETNNSNIVENNLPTTRRHSWPVSELSWTKCISSSSATNVTVSSIENVCIDNKLPVLKLTNIYSKKNNENGAPATNNITSPVAKPNAADDIDFPQSNSDLSFSVDIDNLPQKNLSSSSSDCSSKESCHSSVGNKPPSILEKLASKLKLFDIQIVRWVGDNGYNSDAKVKEIQDKLFSDKFLKEEAEVIVLCNNINRTLSKSNDKEEIIPKPINETQINVNNSSLNESRTHKNNLELEDTFDHEFIKNTAEEKTCGDNDEDDALSLYAESITGMESSTRTNNNPKFEEYVPQHVGDTIFKSPKLISYKPSKIPIKPQSNVDDIPTVCMKQNADSTSIYRDNHENSNFEEIYEDRIGNVKEGEKITHNSLKEFNVKPKTAIKSDVFKGVCFFHLIQKCNRKKCTFAHDLIQIDKIKNRLTLLEDNEFKSEYALLRSWKVLLQTYGRYFVDECIRRQHTKALIEMALDFIRNSNPNVTYCVLEVEIMENTLLYLNNVDLETYQDMLRLIVRDGVLLCDVFLNVIAKSQNFFRFKTVFINLTNFVFDTGRTFDSDVAANFLERVSILPYDEGLARALIKVLENTEPSLFYNSMIGDFEKQLLKSNVDLHVQLILLRNLRLASQPVLDKCYSSPLTDMDKLSTSMGYSEKNIRYSPDTTNLDNMNKTPTETKFTRTINSLMSYNNFTSNSNSTDCSEDKTPSNKFKYKNRNVKYNMRGKRPPYKRRFKQSFEAGFSKYPQRSGPSFY